ncbi:hypothetical protein JCM3766R1_003749 [Sporobolomyces carnicolor]
MSSRPSAALESTAAAPLAPSSPFSRLPFELVTQIIESCVPLSFHSTTYEERQKNLRLLCLVSRLFHRIAKPLLEAVVYSGSDQHFRQWRQEQRDSTDGGVVRELVLLLDGTDLAAELQLVFQSQLQLTTLVLDRLRETLDLANLGHLEINGRLAYDPDDEDDVEFLPDFVSALGADPELSQLSLLYPPPVLSERNVFNSTDNSTRQDLLNLCRDRKIEDDIAGDPNSLFRGRLERRPSLRVRDMDVKAATDSKPAIRAASLLSLSDELLQAIFNAGGPYSRVPLVCKRFVPFYRAQINYKSIYHTIKIESSRALLKLARTLSWNPSLGRLVRHLVITAQGRITVEQVEAMFNEMPKLVTLAVVDYNGEVCDGFLKADSAKCGPNLEHLHLRAVHVQTMVEDPFSAANLAALSKRSKLSKLDLIFESLPSSSLPSVSTLNQIALPSLKSINLSGDLTTAAPAITLFLAQSSPSAVALYDGSPQPCLTKVFSALTYPQSVKSLFLSCRVDSKVPQNFHQDLAQFKKLNWLELSGGAMSGASPSLYTVLRKLSTLKTLTFGPSCDVSAIALSNLISDYKKRPALTKIQLNNISAKEGTYVKFTSNGLDKLIESARQGRVELSGTAMSIRSFDRRFKWALAKAKDREDEAKWIVSKRGCNMEEAYEILRRRDEREEREKYGYFEAEEWDGEGDEEGDEE